MNWIAFVTYLAAVTVGLLVAPSFGVKRVALQALIVLAIIVGFFGGRVAIIGYYSCAAIAALIAALSVYDRRNASKIWLARYRDPIELKPPFRGTWKVLAGGPDPRRNHHQVVSDQYFAYDLVRQDGQSWDSEILAPCDGVVAHVEDGHPDAAPSARRRDFSNPAGNYVALETAGHYVILAHLKNGTIAVREGDVVRAGDFIARCGNSGNTTRSHLHIHAQDRPKMQVNKAKGVPITFGLENGHVTTYGDVVTGS